MKSVKRKLVSPKQKFSSLSMQSIIMIVFTVLSILIALVTGFLLYLKFSDTSKQMEVKATQETVRQTKEAMEDYLMRMRQISDTVYYSVVKENDFSFQVNNIHQGMNILYESNKDNLASVAIYNNYGSLVAAEPVALQKESPEITKQDWYQAALNQVENIHFSTPHVQNLFDNGTQRYDWVISLSRAVELNNGGQTQQGVLLVDMNYYYISHMMEQLNTSNSAKYYYLSDSQGNIIYHPKQIQLLKGLAQENNLQVTQYPKGSYDETFAGQKRNIIVDDVSYTGWKLVGVMPADTFAQDRFQIRLFIALYLVLITMVLLVLNRLISSRISRPIQRLNDSVMDYESGKKPEIYIGGSSEIIHLGQSIEDSYTQIDTLMKEIITEHNERRKSELDVLQSQINPHFLYNTLESITWMIEGEQNDKASFMVTQLAKLFRISLSKGQTIISIGDELQHARSYMNIQKQRYQDKVEVIFDMDPDIEKFATVKLILQPILENSLNYAVSDVEDDGFIKIEGRLADDKIIISISDNGMGMSETQVANLLNGQPKENSKGSGVGLVNVNKRLQLFFGEDYGLKIESQLDFGTTVTIFMPAILYTEENRQILEQGFHYGGQKMVGRATKEDVEDNLNEK
ncbi:cache domain-containing sensor histidine kinase [Enterococcus timonensis]|uniref:cache domain-containing sensor histidine kinase n=1 Tax=Enterococcus timonensis TaxID=1852364 RepID=UPI000ABD59A1|nr:sensor histidine kinase [Enterococcus timonensis]